MKIHEAEALLGQERLVSFGRYQQQIMLLERTLGLEPWIPGRGNRARFPQLPEPVRVDGPRPSALVLVSAERRDATDPTKTVRVAFWVSPRQIEDTTRAEWDAHNAALQAEREAREAANAKAAEWADEAVQRLAALGVRATSRGPGGLTISASQLPALLAFLPESVTA